MTDQSPRRGLVLSGGGGRGAFELGVLEYLESVGWRPDVLVGTSIGSMNSAVYAVGGIERLQAMWEAIRTRDMHRLLPRSTWDGLFDRQPWKKTLEKFAPEAELARLKTPLYVVATDTVTGHPIIYTNDDNPKTSKAPYQKGPITHAHLLASSSIPFIYPRTRVGQANCWDGAVMYNSPLNPAIDAGARQIVAVLLSPYHKQEAASQPTIASKGSLPPVPSSLAGQLGYVLDMALIGTFENDFEQLRKVNRQIRTGQDTNPDHKEIECTIIAPDYWLSPVDIISYGGSRARKLRADGFHAAKQTWGRIQEHGWDSLYGL